MPMLLKTFFPVSLSRADVAEVALSAREFVNDPHIRELGILTLNEKHDDNREELLKTILRRENGRSSRKVRIR